MVSIPSACSCTTHKHPTTRCRAYTTSRTTLPADDGCTTPHVWNSSSGAHTTPCTDPAASHRHWKRRIVGTTVAVVNTVMYQRNTL